jgi:hypothetical protein
MTVVANWRGSGLGPIVPTDIKYTAKNVHPMIQPIIRIKKKIGRTNIISRPQRMYAPYYK